MRRTSIEYRLQAQVRADAERAIASSQAAHAKFAAAAARNTIAHPTATVVKEPPTRVTAPRPTKTIPAVMRARPNARRWRYSNGQIMRRMPDRGGDAHHPRRPLGPVLSFCAFIGILPVNCGVGYPTTYKNDITLISALSRAAGQAALACLPAGLVRRGGLPDTPLRVGEVQRGPS